MSASRHLTLRERLYEELVQMIVSGELEPGAALDERALIAKLSVSRTPFREAIGTLEKAGLVEIKPYRGFFVRALSRKQVEDLYELRKTLECFAVRLAVPRMTDADVDRFETVLDRAVTALRQGDMAAYAEHDRSFHEGVATLADNHALVEALERLALQIQVFRVMANRSADLAERAALERDRILAAFRNRDVEYASALMREHIADVQQVVMAALAANEMSREGMTGA
ncbi:GntR family transcriptional regulator [Terrarubrum flagellatum]|uniref:GntR family transcriptional regulator n=1 Tax=Terrirubrum flagellatum TaxID=2895980 RepID=UPI00314504C5